MIVCIGDSITAGQHVPAGCGWVEILGLVNAGVSGDTTRLALERFPRDVQERRPECVVIQFGHNDANRWQTDCGLPRVSLDAYRANLAEMIDRARTFGARPVFIGLTKPNRSSAYVGDCLAYEQALRAVAISRQAPLCLMWARFGQDDYLDDGLHLNEIGHRRYAELVAQCL